jgi:hypothetical protein
MPRKKSLPPTNSTLNAVVAALAKENARLKEDFEAVQSDLGDTVDRMMDNERTQKKAMDAVKRDLTLLMKEIDGKAPACSDLQWYINRLRITRSQLDKMRKQVAQLERICEENGIDVEENDDKDKVA